MVAADSVALYDYESVAKLQSGLDAELVRLLEADDQNDKGSVERQVTLTLAYAETLRTCSKYDEREAWEECGRVIDKYGLDFNDILERVDEALSAVSNIGQAARQAEQ